MQPVCHLWSLATKASQTASQVQNKRLILILTSPALSKMLLSGNCVIHIFPFVNISNLSQQDSGQKEKRDFSSSVSFIFLNQINIVNYKGCPHLTHYKSKKNSCGPQPLTKFKPDILQRNQGPHLLMLKCTTVANELKEADVERTY